jgi:hypothetical protein
LSEQSNTEAFYGRFHKADELSRKASSMMEQQGDRDSAARFLARQEFEKQRFG